MQVNTIFYYTKTYTVASIVLGKATLSIKCMYLRSESNFDVFMRHLSAVTFSLGPKHTQARTCQLYSNIG